MRKFIANTHDLQAELRRLLAYAEEAHPSRAVMASELRDLADRVVTAKVKKLPSQGTTQRWAVMDGDKTLGFVEKTRRSTATRLEPFHAFVGDGKDEKSVGTFYDDKEKDRLDEKSQAKFKWGGFDAAVEAVEKAAK